MFGAETGMCQKSISCSCSAQSCPQSQKTQREPPPSKREGQRGLGEAPDLALSRAGGGGRLASETPSPTQEPLTRRNTGQPQMPILENSNSRGPQSPCASLQPLRTLNSKPTVSIWYIGFRIEGAVRRCAPTVPKVPAPTHRTGCPG